MQSRFRLLYAVSGGRQVIWETSVATVIPEYKGAVFEKFERFWALNPNVKHCHARKKFLSSTGQQGGRPTGGRGTQCLIRCFLLHGVDKDSSSQNTFSFAPSMWGWGWVNKESSFTGTQTFWNYQLLESGHAWPPLYSARHVVRCVLHGRSGVGCACAGFCRVVALLWEIKARSSAKRKQYVWSAFVLSNAAAMDPLCNLVCHTCGFPGPTSL